MTVEDQLYFHVYESKSTREINVGKQLDRVKKSNPQFHSWALKKYSTERVALSKAFDKFLSSKNKRSSSILFADLEQQATDYISAVQGLYLYDKCGFSHEDWEQGASPIDNLRKALYFFWSTALVNESEARGINDPRYEVICVLFNLTSCLLHEINSKIENEERKEKVNVIKEAYQTMLLIAGMYEQMIKISQEISSEIPVPFEMQPETLEIFKETMLAYAQELAAAKLEMNGGKPALIAALSSDTVEKLKKTVSFWKTRAPLEDDENDKEKFDAYLDYLEIKMGIQKILCMRHAGVLFNEQDENGKAIAISEQCIALSTTIQKPLRSYTKKQKSAKKLEKRLKTLIKEVKNYLEKYQLENSTVYYQKVPDTVDMPQGRSLGEPKEYLLPPVHSNWTPQVYELFADPLKRKNTGHISKEQVLKDSETKPSKSKDKDCVLM